MAVRPRRLSVLAFWGLASWALPLAIVFIISPKLLHLLGAERFGVLMIALVTPLIAVQLDLGITTAAVRGLAAQMSSGKVDAGRTLFTLAVTLALIGFVLGAALWAAAPRVSNALGFAATLGPAHSVELIRVCALWAMISLAALVPGLVARAGQALVLISIVQTAVAVSLWLGAWMLLRQGMTLVHVIGLAIVLTVLSAGVTLLAIRSMIDWRGPVRFAGKALTEDARFSAGMFAAQAAGTLVNQGDRLLVAALGSTGMAGLYALCMNIANKSVAAVVAINSFVLPHAASLRAAGRADATPGLLHALERAVMVLIAPLLVPGLLLAETFLRLWLGSFATPELATAFRIMLIAFAILSLSVPISSVLVGSGDAGLNARYAWLTVVVVLGSMVFTVPRFGLVGAALAVLLGYATSILFAFRARRRLGIPAAAGRGRFWSGLLVGGGVQAALIATLASRTEGWIGLLALGAGAWASFYVARAAVAALSPEERQLLQRMTGKTESERTP